MENAKQTSREYFLFLTIIHTAMLLGQLLFVVVAYYIVSSGQVQDSSDDLDHIFKILVPVVIIAGLAGSWLLARFRIRSILAKTDLKQKLVNYRTMFITKLAMLELPSLVAIVAFLLTTNYLFLALAGLIILVFIINRPTKFVVANELKLNHTEMTALADPNTIIS